MRNPPEFRHASFEFRHAFLQKRVPGVRRQTNPALQNLAQLLLTQEAGVDSSTEAMARVCDKLRLHLAKLMGLDGFTLLLVRSLTFARGDFPWLETIQAERDGSLNGLRPSVQTQEPAELMAGFAAVLAYFFGLLLAFIGGDLTLRLIRGIWPDNDILSDTCIGVFMVL